MSIHPLHHPDFEKLLTEYRMASQDRGARATCEQMERVQRKIISYVDKHYVRRSAVLEGMQFLGANVSLNISDGGV